MSSRMTASDACGILNSRDELNRKATNAADVTGHSENDKEAQVSSGQ